MKKGCFVFLILIFSFQFVRAEIVLSADVELFTSSVSLRWNMVNYSSTTAYVLLKSTDGVVWESAAANPVFRNYNSSTILAYRDHFWEVRKYFYRVKVYNIDYKTIALSNIAVAEIPVKITPTVKSNSSEKSYPLVKSNTDQRNAEANTYSGVKARLIYPNPVQDELNIAYKRTDALRGIIKVMIQDATGKVILQFRQASNNKRLRIPVSNLRRGFYFIKIDVLGEVQMNEKFVQE